MALLYRFVKIDDRPHTHVFTFVVTRSVTRDIERDVTSKEFTCGHHKWAITFSRTEKVLGVYLVWKSVSDNMRVYVDFSFTLLNRQHFSVNEAFSGKQVKFTTECPAQGNRNYISVSELYSRNFTDPNGEFQLELCMGHVRSVYDAVFRMAAPNLPTIGGGLGGSGSGTGCGSGGGGQLSSHRQHMAGKLETSYFSFAGFDWTLAFYPNGLREAHGTNEPRIALYLNRCTGFDHQCRVKFNVVIGEGSEHRVESGNIDDVSNSEGKSYGWHPRAKYTDFIRNGVVELRMDLIRVNTVCEIISNITFQQPHLNSSQILSSGVISTPVVSQCYDRDKQGWTIKCDCHSETVRIHMIYKDIHNIPRNHLRYVGWKAYILKYKRKSDIAEPIKLPGAPFSHYYCQEPSDEGIIMETDLLVKDLRDPNCAFITEKNQIHVQIEWADSYMLFQSTYHKYDDVIRLHNQQMRREIGTLQSENYSLERQLVSYQKTIAFAHSRAGNCSEDQTVDSREEDGRNYFPGKEYSLGDRTLSTDTDYA